MCDADGRISRVDALTTRARCAEGIDAQVARVNLDVDLVGLRHDGDRCGRSLNATLALGLGNALDAVDAGLVLHDRVHLVARKLELDGLETAGVGGAGINRLELPSTTVGKAAVHSVEVACEDVGLIAAGCAANLDDGVLLVVGVTGDEEDLDLFLKAGKLCLVLLDFLLQHGACLGVGLLAHELAGGVDVIEGAHVFACLLHERHLVRALLGQTRILFGVADHSGVVELLLQCLVVADKLFEFVAHGALLS